MQNCDDVKQGIQGFINHWKQLLKKTLVSSVGNLNGFMLSLAWSKSVLDLPYNFCDVSKDVYWPMTRFGPSFED